MPIYEYKPTDSNEGCERCRDGMDVIQGIHEAPLAVCPYCGGQLERVFSAANIRVSARGKSPVENQIRDYEKQRMYSHAAELADKEAEKTKREDLKARALDNYKKAGYKDL